tara:strand:+ start:6084 stop:7745 length:1662 start_codon:yes stop_codon:yes gene_type:complete
MASGLRIEDGDFLQGPKFGALYEGIQGNGVIYGYEAGQSGTGALTIGVSGGSAVIGQKAQANSSGIWYLTHDAADATYPRYDLITGSKDGTPFIQKGTAGSIPSVPTGLNQTIPLATVFIGSNATVLLNGDIAENRGFATQVVNRSLNNHLVRQELRNIQKDYNEVLQSGTSFPTKLGANFHLSGIGFHYDDFFASGNNNYIIRKVPKVFGQSGTEGTFGAVSWYSGDIGSALTESSASNYGGNKIIFGQMFDDMTGTGSWSTSVTAGDSVSFSAIGGSFYEFKLLDNGGGGATGKLYYDGKDIIDDFTGSVVIVSAVANEFAYSASDSIQWAISGAGFSEVSIGAWDAPSTPDSVLRPVPQLFQFVFDTGQERVSVYRNGSRVVDGTSFAGATTLKLGVSCNVPNTGHLSGTFGPMVYIGDAVPTNPMQVTTLTDNTFDTNINQIFFEPILMNGDSPSGTPFNFQTGSGIQLSVDSGATWTNVTPRTFQQLDSTGSELKLKFLPDGSTFPDPTKFTYQFGASDKDGNQGFKNLHNFPTFHGYAFYSYDEERA